MVKLVRSGAALLAAAALVSAAACTSLRTVDAPPSAKIVAVGDTVRVMTKDGKKREITLDRVSERDLSGQVKTAPFASHRETIKFADIKRLEKRETSAWKSTGAILAGGGILTFLAVSIASGG